MKKPFLLIMGSDYYPSRGTGDWQGTYESYEEAEDNVVETETEHYSLKEDTSDNSYDYYDWYKIVDLRNWTE